jgi:pimeloyl-ACP methyl ester carboxylesterase
MLFLWLLISAGVSADEVTVPFKGLTLAGELKLPEGKQLGDGPVFLITHGTLAHSRMEIIQTLQQQLVVRGYGTLAITLSLGQDHRPNVYDCTTLQNHRHTGGMEEIGAWVAWLKSQGAKQVVLLGHSRGGNQSAWFAAEHDDPIVSKVVLLAPMTWNPRGAIDSYRRDYGADLRSVFAQAQKRVSQGQGDAPMKEVGFLHCRNASVTAATFIDYYRNDPRFDTPVLLKSIARPVLVIVGTDDKVVPDLAKKVQPLADGDRIQLKLVDGADHFFRDLYAEEAVDAIAAFAGPAKR